MLVPVHTSFLPFINNRRRRNEQERACETEREMRWRNQKKKNISFHSIKEFSLPIVSHIHLEKLLLIEDNLMSLDISLE